MKRLSTAARRLLHSACYIPPRAELALLAASPDGERLAAALDAARDLRGKLPPVRFRPEASP